MNITDLNKVLENVKNSGKTVVNAKDIRGIVKNLGLTPSYEYHAKQRLQSGPKRGEYFTNEVTVQTPTLTSGIVAKHPEREVEKPMINSAGELLDTKEVKDPTYVPWGQFNDIKRIAKSGQFFPTFIEGPSGNGKTMMVRQAIANANGEMIRVQISEETDTDDLIGGWSLINGETVFRKGPILLAMEKGIPVLLDEVDRGSNKLLALQGIMEGSPYFIKKTGETVYPRPGFNIYATANTKGQGCDSGKFSGATIIDDAFLERFPITVEQRWPTIATEKKIVANHFVKFGMEVDDNLVSKLLDWSDAIRKTYDDGGIDEVISTRRLCFIAQTYAIFGDIRKSIELCINRFSQETKEAFLEIFDALGDGSEASVSSEVDLGVIIDEALA